MGNSGSKPANGGYIVTGDRNYPGAEIGIVPISKETPRNRLVPPRKTNYVPLPLDPVMFQLWNVYDHPIPCRVALPDMRHGLALGYQRQPNGSILVAYKRMNPLDPILDQKWDLFAVESVVDGRNVIERQPLIVSQFLPDQDHVTFLDGNGGFFNITFSEAKSSEDENIKSALNGLLHDYPREVAPRLLKEADPPSSALGYGKSQTALGHMAFNNPDAAAAWVKKTNEYNACMRATPAPAPVTIDIPSCPRTAMVKEELPTIFSSQPKIGQEANFFASSETQSRSNTRDLMGALMGDQYAY